MRAITDRQIAVLKFITNYIDRCSYAPSVREIAEHFQVNVRTIQDHIMALKRKGYVKNNECKSRTLVVLKEVS